MAKIVLIVLGLVLVYWILKRYRRGVDTNSQAPRAKNAEDMVRCEHCGVHLPRSESITAGGRFFCTSEHRDRHEGR